MSSSSFYSRNTELRNVEAKDLYNLAVILEDDNYWQQLMEIIPKEINNQAFATDSTDLEKVSLESTFYERKYSNDHIRLLKSAILRPGESRLVSQILFDEWGSSGRKHERPTLGLLLHLLVKSKLYRAADFVSELLKESKPTRPMDGPAAEYEFEIDVVFKDIQEAVNDSRFYPNTEDLQENINNDNKSCMNINRDYYTKYHEHKDKKLPTIVDNNTEVASAAPKPPPRSQKSARLLKKQQQQLELQQTSNISGTFNTNNITPNCIEEQNHHQLHSNDILISTTTTFSTNMPKLSALMNLTNSETTTMNYSIVSDNSLPKLSLFDNSSDSEYSSNSIPSIKPHVADHNHHAQHVDLNSLPTVISNKPLHIDVIKDKLQSDNDEQHHDLPAISALNLNGERDDDKSSLETSKNIENVPSVALNYSGTNSKHNGYDNADLDIPCMVANIKHDDINQIRHHLEAIEEDYNGIEHEHENEHDHDHDEEDDFIEDDDENSIPNLSFLENRSSNNESSLTSVTNTSGDNSFEQSVNDCSSTSTDNIPFLSVFNQ